MHPLLGARFRERPLLVGNLVNKKGTLWLPHAGSFSKAFPKGEGSLSNEASPETVGDGELLPTLTTFESGASFLSPVGRQPKKDQPFSASALQGGVFRETDEVFLHIKGVPSAKISSTSSFCGSFR